MSERKLQEWHTAIAVAAHDALMGGIGTLRDCIQHAIKHTDRPTVYQPYFAGSGPSHVPVDLTGLDWFYIGREFDRLFGMHRLSREDAVGLAQSMRERARSQKSEAT